jgi:fatty acid desaturase
MPLTASTPAVDTDEPVDPWEKPVPADVIRRLSVLQPVRTLAHIGLEWLLVAAAIFLSTRLWQWNVYAGAVGYLAAVIWIGSRQHAIAILMHEAAHYRLFRNRVVNDALGELFVGWPMLLTMRAYRRLHFAHHRSPNTVDDPDWMLRLDRDWQFPKTRTDLLRIFAIDILGLHIWDQLRFFGRYGHRFGQRVEWLDFAGACFFGVLFWVLTRYSLWTLFLLYWIVPLMTWLKVVLRLRTIGEHYALEYDHIFRQTRTTYPTLLEQLLIAPKNIAYHLDHHLYPSVPFYNLPALHKELLRHDEFRAQAHLTRSYLQVLGECLRCTPTPAAAQVRS